jgi:hypothetical protein
MGVSIAIYVTVPQGTERGREAEAPERPTGTVRSIAREANWDDAGCETATLVYLQTSNMEQDNVDLGTGSWQ